MTSNSRLPPNLEAYLGTANRCWELKGNRLESVTLYTAAEAPLLKCSIEGPDFIGQCEGIDLVRDVGPQHLSCMGLLIWFPQFSEFGSWNPGLHRVKLYVATGLADIVKNPAAYFGKEGILNREVFPYSLEPWRKTYRDDERCSALIVCAKNLHSSKDSFPRALTAALTAAETGRDVSPNIRKISENLAEWLIGKIPDRQGVVEMCDEMLGAFSLSPRIKSWLEKVASRHEYNSGNEIACIRRLERILADKYYSEYHDQFSKVLERIK